MRNGEKIWPRALLLGASLILAAPIRAGAVSLWPQSLAPSLYLIEGYLDRAPERAPIVDRIDIEAHGRRRTLLVTSYGPGEIMLDRYLSRGMIEPYTLQGTDDEVSRVIDAPPGTEIRGTFAVYTEGPPWLMIADLGFPDRNSRGGRPGS